ncbi:signal peptidase II [Natranaerovirga hydrolytica]|uniref:Lipoprotein signal peptidase n=1 Tax=Natranaerovirga hydrolytica TaxID=680378 RepID=A0A4R1MXV4_9FIRM|nr:signal peptidase II [Natranaerovirga hydrolytica]TCK98108.1 signal peptidase II [Natranaerovirga hydrolytica]
MISIIIIVLFMVGFDQITKYFAIEFLKNANAITIIPNVFELTYVENRGAAFGIMQGRVTFFTIVTILSILFIIYFYRTIPKDKKYNLIRMALILILAGGLGNLIDRIVFGYVVDFLHFKLIRFPVFNLADCYVTIGSIFLMVLVLFVYKDDEVLNPKKDEKQ